MEEDRQLVSVQIDLNPYSYPSILIGFRSDRIIIRFLTGRFIRITYRISVPFIFFFKQIGLNKKYIQF